MCVGKDSGQHRSRTERYFDGSGSNGDGGYARAPDYSGLMAIVMSVGGWMAKVEAMAVRRRMVRWGRS